jgi:hypothetical protein
LYGKLSDDRITRWRLLLEEYGPKHVHIAGKNNIVADALSSLEKNENESSVNTSGKAGAQIPHPPPGR